MTENKRSLTKRKYNSKYRIEHIDKIREINRRASSKYYNAHKAERQEHRNSNKEQKKEYDRIRREKLRKSIREAKTKYHNLKYKTDTNYKLISVLRSRLCSAIKHKAKRGSFIKDLGCSVPELKKHLEERFQPGMAWENWGKYGWHIDHITPLSAFDLTNREEFLVACNYKNLQPLWAEENRIKSNKINGFIKQEVAWLV